uniref:hypothetical protein n=1 Tax=Flavobacterium sp. TaxID=239 RepID=UPI004048F143
MKKIHFIIFGLLCCGKIFSQSIFGNFSILPNQVIKLEGFNGLKNYPISSTTIDEKGNFKLNYTTEDYGIGYLMSSDNKPIFVILSGENIEIVGETLSYTETIKITKGLQNKLFEQYAKEHPKREQVLSAWGYLEKIYASDSLFSIQKSPLKAIYDEKLRIKNEDDAFLEALPKDTYIKWFSNRKKGN